MENPVIGFGLEYAGSLIYCEAIMFDTHYKILFDGKEIGTIEHTENFNWVLASGTILPESVVEEIGAKIESSYS